MYLADIAEIIMGQSPSRENCNSKGHGLPLLNGPTEFGPSHPTPVQFTTDPRKKSQSADLLFCVRGSTTGRMNWSNEPYAIGRGIAAIRDRRGSAFQPLLRAIIELSLPDLLQAATGSTFPNVSYRQLAELPFPVLSDESCLSLSSFFGALDDKIDLNRRTNETLEAMARALFRDWFVDFGPTRAKMAGQTPYLAPEIWELFPDRLDDEGKPEGWNCSSIYEVASVIYGAPFASSLFNTQGEGIPLARIRDLPSEKPGVWTTENHPKGFKILPGMIVVGMDGEFRAHLWGGEEAWLNQRVCVFHPNEGISSVFLRETIIPQLKFIEDTEVATTVIHLGKGDIDEFTAIVPSHSLMSAFNDTAEVFYEKIVRNKKEARSLAQLRALLLPKLMSGKIRIHDAEKMVEDAL